MDMLQSLGMSKDLIADLLINIVSIIVLYLVVKKLAYNPVKKFLDARTEKVEAQKAEAASKIQTILLLGCALAESTAIYAFVVALILSGK